MSKKKKKDDFALEPATAAVASKTWTSSFVTSKCRHDATACKVGPHTVWLGSESAITRDRLKEIDLVISLNGNFPSGGYLMPIHALDCYMQDFNAPKPETWRLIVDYIGGIAESGKRVLIFCTGGHGRTGTLAASLIAKFEPNIDDPIVAVRERYCEHAVESAAQREAIYEILGRELPEKYKAVKYVPGKGSSTISTWDATTRTWKYTDAQGKEVTNPYAHVASGGGGYYSGQHDCKHTCPACGTAWSHASSRNECGFPSYNREYCMKCFQSGKAPKNDA